MLDIIFCGGNLVFRYQVIVLNYASLAEEEIDS